MSNRFGLLLIGGAHTHQENYARAFAADSRCRLIGLTDETNLPPRRQALNAQLAAELDIPLFADPAAALRNPQVDLVSVCAEPERRARLAIEAARCGKHVYLDKPLACGIDAAVELAETVSENGVRGQMFSLVRSSVASRARQMIASGRLGRLVAMHCELLFAKGHPRSLQHPAPRQESPAHERFTWIDSKRELFCVGLYPLVLFPWLTGTAVESVSALTANAFFPEHEANDAEDLAAMMISMQNGVHASLFVGRTGWQSHPGHGIHQLHLVGTEGTVTIDAWKPRLEIFSAGGNWQPPNEPHPEDPMGFWSSTQQENGILPKTDWWPVAEQAVSDSRAFLDAIETGRPSDVSIDLGAHAVEAILRGYESAALGKPVAVDATRSIMQRYVAEQQQTSEK